jgi:hypothetical protein
MQRIANASRPVSLAVKLAPIFKANKLPVAQA